VKSLVVLVLVGGTALAHHPTSSTVPIPANRVEVGLALTRFDHDGHHGFVETLSLAGELRVLPWLSLGAVLPFHLLQLEDGPDAFGPGDLTLHARAHAVTWERGGLIVRLDSELPTGRTSRGLGSGHAEVGASVTVHHQAGSLLLVAAAGIMTSLTAGHEEEGEEHAHQYVNPHDNQQLELLLLGGWTNGRLALAGGLHTEVPLSTHEGADLRLVPTITGTLTDGDVTWRLTVQTRANDERPFTGRVMLHVGYAPPP
jgi:hypothetical protein